MYYNRAWVKSVIALLLPNQTYPGIVHQDANKGLICSGPITLYIIACYIRWVPGLSGTQQCKCNFFNYCGSNKF